MNTHTLFLMESSEAIRNSYRKDKLIRID